MHKYTPTGIVADSKWSKPAEEVVGSGMSQPGDMEPNLISAKNKTLCC